MWKRVWTLAAAVIVLTWVLLNSRTFAEAEIPSGVFVRGSDGLTWWVLGDRKLQVPFYPATDEQIAALPSATQWIVPSETGRGIVAGSKPDWATTGVNAPASAADAPPPQPPQQSTSASAPSKRVGETTVLTSPSGLRVVVLVNAVEDNVPPRRNDDPAMGRYFLVDWTLKNEGAEDFRVSVFDVKLQTSDGFVIDRTVFEVREPELRSTTLGPGQVIRGWLTYDVPRSKPVSSAIYQPGSARQFVIADLT
jgi:hypothetical protein